MKRESHSPLIVAIVLSLLPVLYVGSYLALVKPGGMHLPGFVFTHYRYGHRISERAFWPLEQIDRKVRPSVWSEDPFG
jgi:hypothetical protein